MKRIPSARRRLLCIALGAAWVSAARAAHPEPSQAAWVSLLQWPRRVLRLVVKYQQNPIRAARALACVCTAMEEAASAAGGPVERRALAAHRAASLVAAHLYPAETLGVFEAAFMFDIADAQLDRQPGDAHSTGRDVAQAMILRCMADGASRVWLPHLRPSRFEGRWEPAYPLFAADPTEGLAGEWQTWVQPAADRYTPPAAGRPGSESHTQETMEVLEISRSLSQAQKDAAFAWNLGAGSVTPAGIWMQQSLRLVIEEWGKTDELASLEAVLAATAATARAMHDAFIACWRVKMRDWSERPITAIRRSLDPGFTPLLVTPSFPSYVSGHAVVSAAAAGVLAHFHPRQGPALLAMAQEASGSRMWGGIHFRSDCGEGFLLGQAVGREIVRDLPELCHSGRRG